MTEQDLAANRAAAFLPQVDDDTRPCIEVGGALVFAYVKDGELVVSVDIDTADPDVFAVYGLDQVPVQVNVGDTTVFAAR